jgi:uncharacterized membrane protein
MNENLVELLMHIFGGLSCLCSVTLIFIYLTHQSLRYSINNEIIFYIAISDLLSGIGGGIGLVDDGTLLCQFQAIITNIFPLCGIYWTSVLVYLMVGIVANERVIKKIDWKIHFIGWIFPTLITLLPLTTNRYGVAGDNHGWCFIDRLDSSPSWSTLFWMIVSFYAWIWASEILFASFICYLIYILYIQKLSLSSGRRYLLSTLYLYPLSSLLCWILPCYDDIFSSLNNHFIYRQDIATSSLAYLTPLFQGMFTFLIFVFMNHDVLYLVVQSLDRVISFLSCGQFETILAGCLMRYHSSHFPSTNEQDGNNFLRNRHLPEHTSSSSHRHPRVDMTSQDTSSTEYEIKGTFKESYDDCSIVIC